MTANILANLMGGLVDKREITHETIKKALNSVLKELNEGRNLEDQYKAKDFFIMIMPEEDVLIKGQFQINEMSFHIVQVVYSEGKRIGQKIVREITLEEILGIDE